MIDIIIPSYNRKPLLKRAVHSVYNQTYKNWRLFIVDDGSTDGTSLQDYGRKAKILRLSKNKGVSFARNYGIKNTQADWIAFLDSDDEWKENKLEKQVQFLHKNPSAVLIHCNELWIKNGRILNQKKHHKKRGGRIFYFCIDLCCISPSAVLIKRSVFEELGLFREDFPVCEDYEFWLRLSARYEVSFLDEVLLVKYGGRPDQLSTRFYAMDYWRIKALIPFLGSKLLSGQEQVKLKNTLLKKIHLVLKGCKKRGNLKLQKEIEDIYEKLKPNVL